MRGPVGVTFELYAQQSGSAGLWIETQNVTPDASGNYTVLLGVSSANGVPPELFASGEARWLGLRAEQQVEQPRVLLVSVPCALKAGDAETLGGRPASDFLVAPVASPHRQESERDQVRPHRHRQCRQDRNNCSNLPLKRLGQRLPCPSFRCTGRSQERSEIVSRTGLHKFQENVSSCFKNPFPKFGTHWSDASGVQFPTAYKPEWSAHEKCFSATSDCACL
jgi:hypothetical protein